MRRHATASSARSKARKSSGLGSSHSSGRLRLTVLLATVAAFMLVPAAQAFAAAPVTVEILGTGSGEVQGAIYPGTPPMACSYNGETETQSGVCENVMTEEGEEQGEGLEAIAAPGSKLTGWEYEADPEAFAGCFTETLCAVTQTSENNGAAHFTVYFEKEVAPGPTNKRLLTLTKSPSPSAGTGQGTVKSKPKGINCASTCSGATASLYKNSTVVLTEKPTGETSTFVEWNGCDSETEGKCVVTMSEAKEVEAVFAGTSKAIPNPQALTVSKVDNGFETGQGTVKSKPGGIACENDCTETAALFAGTLTEPKPKAATKVVLTATKAPGSVFSGWTGCDEEVEGACVVTMSEAKAVTAEFTALPKNTLTLTKSPSPSAGTGVGTVTSKPKGIKCATACSEEQASLPEDATVVLKGKAATGSTLAGWEGCESTTVISATEGTCTVSMATAQEVTAEFGGVSKAILNPQALTLAKAGSGYGTVKSKPGGIACEAACTATTALYQGTLTEPKPKAAATVTLTATSAPGSQTVVWSGCDEEVEGACVVSMSEAKEVTATFDELE